MWNTVFSRLSKGLKWGDYKTQSAFSLSFYPPGGGDYKKDFN